jgi:hypothetical protein
MIDFNGWELITDNVELSYFIRKEKYYMVHRRESAEYLYLAYNKDLNSCQISASIKDRFIVAIYEGKLESQEDLNMIQTLLSI